MRKSLTILSILFIATASHADVFYNKYHKTYSDISDSADEYISEIKQKSKGKYLNEIATYVILLKEVGSVRDRSGAIQSMLFLVDNAQYKKAPYEVFAIHLSKTNEVCQHSIGQINDLAELESDNVSFNITAEKVKELVKRLINENKNIIEELGYPSNRETFRELYRDKLYPTGRK